MSEKRLDSSELAELKAAGKSVLAQARSDLAASQLALAESLEATAFLKSVLDASQDCIKVLTLDGDLIYMNEGGKAVMEVDDFETIRGCAWTSFWQGDGRALATAALEAARDGRVGNFQGPAPTAKGTEKYWDVTVTRIPGRDGHEDSFLSISRDITASKHLEEQKELLSRELGHRIKNTLSVVQAIATQTFRGQNGGNIREFNARLAALGEAQQLLLQSAWERVSVRELISKTLAPMCPPSRIAVDVDDTQLDGRRGLSLALALHELGTNAVKYGALSGEVGEVQISFTKGADGISMTWREINGPSVEPPTRTGFGTRLITRNLEADFGGTVQMNYQPSGLVVTLSAPS